MEIPVPQNMNWEVVQYYHYVLIYQTRILFKDHFPKNFLFLKSKSIFFIFLKRKTFNIELKVSYIGTQHLTNLFATT